MTRFGANPGSVVVALLVVLILAGTCWYVFIPANIISVSSINLDTKGASIGDYVNNDYRKLSGGYWAITLTINSYQSVYAIKFGPENVTGVTFNGQKVITNRVVQFNIDPQIPYLEMALTSPPQGGIQFAPSATGWEMYDFKWDKLDVLSHQITTNPAFVNYFYPKPLSPAIVHCPFNIDVLVAGGLAGSTSQDKTASGTQSWTISPVGNLDSYPIQTSYGTATVQFDGYLASPVQLPWGLDRLTYIPLNQAGSGYVLPVAMTDSAGNKYLVMLDVGDKIPYTATNLNCYGRYLYCGTTSSQLVYGFNAGPLSLQNAPGWAMSQAWYIVGTGASSFWPLQANLTAGGSSEEQYTVPRGFLGDFIRQEINSRMGLLEWLTSTYSYNVVNGWPQNGLSYFPSWKIDNSDANNPKLNAQLPQNIFTPQITLLIPMDMADTLVYSPKVTKFRIDSVDLPANMNAGDQVSLTVKITNTGNTRGTANVKVITDSNLNVLPLTNQLTLDPNQQGSVSFVMSVGSISTQVTSYDKVEVWNTNIPPELCDSRSFSIVLNPMLSHIYTSGIDCPSKIKPGDSATLTVKVTNQGGSAATGTVKITTDSFLTMASKSKTASINPGQELPFAFPFTAGNSLGVSTLKVELYDQNGNLLESHPLQVTVASEASGSSPLAIKSCWLEPASFGNGDLFSLVVKVKSSSLLPVEATVAVTGPVTWGAGSMSAIIFPAIEYEAKFSMIAPLWGSGTLTIQLFDRTQGVLADTKQQDLSPLGIGLLPIVAVLLLIAGGAYFMASYSSKVPGRGIGKSGRK